MIVILMGVAGTGKTTVGKLLAQSLGASFCDADDLHSAANVDKMTRGEPLSDADRRPWLQRVKARIDEAMSHNETLVVACSALKRSYRELLSLGTNDLRFVFLKGSREVLEARLISRRGHFMRAALLDSQLTALEEPTRDEALIVDIEPSPEEIVTQIRKWLKG